MEKSALIHFIKSGFFSNPYFLQIEITDYCPLACPQCYKNETQKNFMKLNLFKDIVVQAKESGIEHIFLNGGEPLSHPDLCEMMSILHKLKLKHTIFTSGYGMNQKFVNIARDMHSNINLSLNGSTDYINSLSRDGYHITLESARILKDNQCLYELNWVARHDNVYDLQNLILLGKSVGAKSINVVCNKITSHGELISPLTYDDYQFLVAVIKENSDYINVQSCYGLLLSLLNAPSNKLYGCQAGIRLMAISCTGEYMPCTHLNFREAFENIDSYWRNSNKLNELRCIDDLKFCDECKLCRFCHSMCKSSHDDLQIGLEDCPIRMNIKV